MSERTKDQVASCLGVAMNFLQLHVLPYQPLSKKPPDPLSSQTWFSDPHSTLGLPNSITAAESSALTLSVDHDDSFADMVMKTDFFQFVSSPASTCDDIIQLTFDDYITSPSNNTVSHFNQIQPHEMDPRAFFSPHQGTFSVIWDTGATRSISGYASDFVGPILAPSAPLRLGGIASGLDVAGIGTVKWIFVEPIPVVEIAEVAISDAPIESNTDIYTTDLSPKIPAQPPIPCTPALREIDRKSVV